MLTKGKGISTFIILWNWLINYITDCMEHVIIGSTDCVASPGFTTLIKRVFSYIQKAIKLHRH
ncbi:hypothetical protein KV34_22320 [Klebsiella aerogenes]|nr:hypothetical protein KV34_22320 [Klebsiella aerogenes]